MKIFSKEIVLLNNSSSDHYYWRMHIDLNKLKTKYLNSKDFMIGPKDKLKRKINIKTINPDDNNKEYSFLLTL